jgi:hypothetical protein
MAKIKQYALCTLARQKMWSYTVEDCIKFKEENWIFPFSDNPWEHDEWIYNFYVEYFKKFKNWLVDNAFFTPLNYAEDIKKIYNFYFWINTAQAQDSILDAFCWIWNLTLGYYNKVEAFDINTEFLKVCEYKNNENNKRIKNKVLTPLRYETAQFPAFNFDYDTRKFSVNELWKTYNCIISNPPFWKYRGSVIDKPVIEFFEKHLNKDWILIAILPNNFYEKYSKFMTWFELLQIWWDVKFDYTGINAKIFVFKKI